MRAPGWLKPGSLLREEQVDRGLRATVLGLGVSEYLADGVEECVVYKADARHRDMSATYWKLNDDLLTLARRGPLRIDHITGEARVLVDPHHRKVISVNHANGGLTRIACRQPKPGQIHDAFTFVAAQKTRWYAMTWMDLIDVVSLAATGQVGMFVLARPADIHYSVYGSSRALLQERHHHPSEKKRVWYVKSRPITAELAEQATATFDAATCIPPQSFDTLRRWMFSRELLPLVGATKLTAGLLDGVSAHVERLEELGILERDPDSDLGYRMRLTRSVLQPNARAGDA